MNPFPGEAPPGRSIRITVTETAYKNMPEKVQGEVAEILRQASPGDYTIDASGEALSVRRPALFSDHAEGGTSGMFFPESHFRRPPREDDPFRKYDPDNDELPPPGGSRSYFT
ncbi:uncharacterized protein NEMAJ01_1465 [Nematocida major]|uniref:uncharacterized protein n=1 Tax=Nematocida major TaxID=1912982 RepID=UPI0020089A90|nr:uncharacterized protein NEMAJ01_1465 [Nematocida major]KAH9386569.1 hypothetical protein NEMAJ01_1465 [Nematocida major]